MEKKWEIEIEWIEQNCFFGKGWNAFAKKSKLEAGDTVVVFNLPSSGYSTLNVCLFKNEDEDLDEDTGISIVNFKIH